jgi:hypothetical protein
VVTDSVTSEQTNLLPSVQLETPTLRGDVVAAVLCLVAGLVGYFLIVPAAVYVPSKVAGTANSPAFLPNLLFLLLTGLSVIYFIQSLSDYLRQPAQGRALIMDWMLAGGTALICVGYITAIYFFGMTLGAVLGVTAMTYYFGERRLWVMSTIAIVLPVLLWYFFEKIAHVLFPTPWLEIMESLESSHHFAIWMA